MLFFREQTLFDATLNTVLELQLKPVQLRLERIHEDNITGSLTQTKTKPMQETHKINSKIHC